MGILISIITPLYNSEDYISETILSVLGQTYDNFEMIIVDDMSTDASKEIVLEFMEQDDRIKYYSLNEKGGAAAARNLATEKANGDYIAFLDADDLWDETKLSELINHMETNEIAFAYSDYRLVDVAGNPTSFIRISPNTLSYKKLLIFSNSIGCLTAMYDARMTGKIYVPLLKKRNDVAIWQLILKQGHIGYRVPKVLASNRAVPNSLSRSTSRFHLLKHHKNLYKENLKMNNVSSSLLALVNSLAFVYSRLFMVKKY